MPAAAQARPLFAKTGAGRSAAHYGRPRYAAGRGGHDGDRTRTATGGLAYWICMPIRDADGVAAACRGLRWEKKDPSNPLTGGEAAADEE